MKLSLNPLVISSYLKYAHILLFLLGGLYKLELAQLWYNPVVIND